MRFSILFLLFITACTIKFPEEQSVDEKQSQEVYDVDGKVKSKISVKDGQLNGEVVTYYPGGAISAVAYFVDNKREGLEKKYYKDGPLYRTRIYENGKTNGLEVRYYKSGSIKSKQEFKKGNPATGLIEYFINGKVNDDYPRIEFKIEDERDYNEQKLLLFYLSDGSENVRYYSGELLEGTYFDNEAEQELSRDGKGELWILPTYSGSITISAKAVRYSRGLFITRATAKIKDGQLVNTIY